MNVTTEAELANAWEAYLALIRLLLSAQQEQIDELCSSVNSQWIVAILTIVALSGTSACCRSLL